VRPRTLVLAAALLSLGAFSILFVAAFLFVGSRALPLGGAR
jgi:hypothetical protein